MDSELHNENLTAESVDYIESKELLVRNCGQHLVGGCDLSILASTFLVPEICSFATRAVTIRAARHHLPPRPI